ncbi:hypothetical protein BST81_14220, partial [Leptolyngbya sp. 'hensonii']|uniref:two-partner secretion domain-containing protein n=1 Tax=Leptolyngbya sp. 'hensonii' TaxID=1922337 RepID=UPI000963F069
MTSNKQQRRNFSILVFSLMASSSALVGLALSLLPAQAQITPAADGTGTIVHVNGNQFDISGGTQAGSNLFHSFQQLGLTQEQIANFMANPNIQNILGRVTGGDPSVLNGLIQVTGGNSNLFLINPGGIIFGPNVQLNVPAAFTATTANGIGMGNGIFSASGPNDYSTLLGNPDSFVFTIAHPGAIVNLGDLTVKDGQSLVLTGGTVISSGKLDAPNGQILVTAMPGDSSLRISIPGSPLSLEIPKPNDWNGSIATLSQLLSGTGSPVNGITTDADGTVHLTGANLQIQPGDGVVQQARAAQVTIGAAHNLILAPVDDTNPASLTANRNLSLMAGNQVIVRDSKAQPVSVQAGGDLTVLGQQGIDILALKHPEAGQAFQSLGDMRFLSDGTISGDAHFASQGRISFLTLSGENGNFVSYYDPIVSSDQDVRIGNYTGASLKVETLGSIYAGDITITSPDTSLVGTDLDIPTLTGSAALILRAGLPSLANPVNLSTQNLLLKTGGAVANVLYQANELAVPPGYSSTVGTAINANGDVAGYGYDASGNAIAAVFPQSGPSLGLWQIPGYAWTPAIGMSDSGMVAI